jgi:hypothetical protein
LKASAEEYREHFVRALGLAIQGTIQAPPDQFGETLESEQLKAGSFIEGAGIEDDKWDRLMEVCAIYIYIYIIIFTPNEHIQFVSIWSICSTNIKHAW